MTDDLAASGIVVCNSGGDRAPAVLVHTWQTDVSRLRALADYLGPTQPLFGIQPPLATDGPMPATVEQWVAHARRALTRIPVTSPYRLGGFSFGGVVALELARELIAEGAELAWLGLIDTLRPKLNPKGASRYLRYHAQEVLDLPDADVRKAYVGRLVRGGTRRQVVKVKRAVRPALVRLGIRDELPSGPALGPRSTMSPEKKSIWLSYLNYEAAPFDHPVALFAGHQNREEASGDPSLRWSGLLRAGYELTAVDGDHLQLFEQAHIHSIGHAIETSLARADAR